MLVNIPYMEHMGIARMVFLFNHSASFSIIQQYCLWSSRVGHPAALTRSDRPVEPSPFPFSSLRRELGDDGPGLDGVWMMNCSAEIRSAQDTKRNLWELLIRSDKYILEGPTFFSDLLFTILVGVLPFFSVLLCNVHTHIIHIQLKFFGMNIYLKKNV